MKKCDKYILTNKKELENQVAFLFNTFKEFRVIAQKNFDEEKNTNLYIVIIEKIGNEFNIDLWLVNWFIDDKYITNEKMGADYITNNFKRVYDFS